MPRRHKFSGLQNSPKRTHADWGERASRNLTKRLRDTRSPQTARLRLALSLRWIIERATVLQQQVCKTRTCIRNCDGWPKGFAIRHASRKMSSPRVSLRLRVHVGEFQPLNENEDCEVVKTICFVGSYL